MFSKRGTERLAGVSLIAAFVAFVAHMAAYLAGNDNLVALCFLVYGVLAILSAVTLCLTFRPFEQTLAVVTASGFAAHGVLIVVFAAMYWAAAEFSAGSPTVSADALTADVGASIVATTARALEMTLGAVMTCAFIVLSLGLGALGILVLWSGAVARWLGWLGAVSGFAGFLGLSGEFSGIEMPDAVPVVLSMLVLVSILILGIRLLARETRAVSTPTL